MTDPDQPSAVNGDATRDELAGVVDLFGGLTRDELTTALAELAFRRGDDVDEDAVEAAVAAAREDYYLVAVERDGDDDLLVPGPAAFPSLPDGAEDLPHILDVERRRVDRERLGRALRRRLAGDVAALDADADRERAAQLLDVTYDAETWAEGDLSDVRDRLRDHLDG